jgi:membrane-bound ClpP family serine protease
MMYLWPISLQALAFAVLFAEVLIPSFGVLSVVALGLGLWSWTVIVGTLPSGGVLAFALADLILVPLAAWQVFRYLGRSPVSHRTTVGTGSGLEESSRILEGQLGRFVTAETPLRPAGKIRLDGEIFEAQTAGEFVEKGGEVRLLAVRGAGFIVEKNQTRSHAS